MSESRSAGVAQTHRQITLSSPLSLSTAGGLLFRETAPSELPERLAAHMALAASRLPLPTVRFLQRPL